MENRKLAVLIDADNAQSSLIAELLAEVAKYGTAIVKRAYGDWTTTQLKGWKEVLHQYAISPIQQFAYTKGKNSTDSALIIDAMDLLYTGNFDGFCLVSSDSDFTRLATRLREGGLTVIGLGEQSKTPRPFIAACDKFVFTEILRPAPPAKPKPEPAADKPKTRASRARAKPAPAKERHPLQDMFTSAIEAVARDSGWAELSAVGSYLAKNDPSFDPRNWGHGRLSQMVKKLDFLTVQESRNGSKLHSEIRLKHEADAHAAETPPLSETAAAEVETPAPQRKKRSPRKKPSTTS
ncbi:NYN domain-containing protein [Chromobacterium sp. IIBBL 290-4]|uniref:NYN domain-containing protein n=1 Tax=Chromobacterium sp. IIBBL 290-4 TaxID=2953890 RepID=UPI0020B8479D|nr:NYN domain-containing protein [Chromobacterium sp. IIBBL 290-4]UTH76048.1 NYN domain-containing protein [Chromobacterium sp. IIBBL 290-4]